MIARRRAQWVLALPGWSLGGMVALVWIILLRPEISIVNGMLTLIALGFLAATVSGIRWAKRLGDSISTWEPQLWSPGRTRRLKAGRLRVELRAQGRSMDLVLTAAPDAPVCLNSYTIGYHRQGSAEQDRERVGDALGLAVVRPEHYPPA